MTTISKGQIDLQELRALGKENRTAKALFSNFAQREKNSLVSKVDRLETILKNGGIPTSRAEIIDVFKKIEEIGCGTFRKSRTLKDGSYNPARFEWTVELISVGRAGIGEPTTVRPVDQVNAVENEETTSDELISHGYQLRPNFKVVVGLPADFSVREAHRLAEFLKTLPFGDETS